MWPRNRTGYCEYVFTKWDVYSTTLWSTWGGGYYANFFRSVIFRIFHYSQNTRNLLKITFIFDRCRRSSAAVASVKYKCDSNNLRSTFERSKILLTEKLTNGALVTPTPGLVYNSGGRVKHKLPCLSVITKSADRVYEKSKYKMLYLTRNYSRGNNKIRTN